MRIPGPRAAAGGGNDASIALWALSSLGSGIHGANRERVALHCLVVNQNDFTVGEWASRGGLFSFMLSNFLVDQGTFPTLAWLRICCTQVPEALFRPEASAMIYLHVKKSFLLLLMETAFIRSQV